MFVAGAASGVNNRVMTSPDGITWTIRTSAANNGWDSITYGNGLFVAVSYNGSGNRVMTSPDGITWTSRTSAANNGWHSITYGNGLFVAVSYSGNGNRVMTSPVGITWTSRTSAADNTWLSVTYGNGVFVAVATTGTNNRVMTLSSKKNPLDPNNDDSVNNAQMDDRTRNVFIPSESLHAVGCTKTTKDHYSVIDMDGAGEKVYCNLPVPKDYASGGVLKAYVIAQAAAAGTCNMRSAHGGHDEAHQATHTNDADAVTISGSTINDIYVNTMLTLTNLAIDDVIGCELAWVSGDFGIVCIVFEYTADM